MTRLRRARLRNACDAVRCRHDVAAPGREAPRSGVPIGGPAVSPQAADALRHEAGAAGLGKEGLTWASKDGC
jgi:hypothetical protein